MLLISSATLVTVISLWMARATTRSASPTHSPTARLPARAPEPLVTKARLSADVWQVAIEGNSELYSNGLRIDNTFGVSHRPRAYLVFPAEGTGPPEQRTTPAGIVFHSTESQQAPFEAGHNETLKRIGESLLDYIRRRRSYHFVIDRFGRVYRVVAEGDAACHAGHSVWADDQWLYVNLNESFLGVAFESQTAGREGEREITAAQTRSAFMLTELLRARHRIAAGNCVTHAQVSVNPTNMRVGYHVDWAAEFPFEELGLPDNYAIPLPAIRVFGFDWDSVFLGAAGVRMRTGVEAAAAVMERQAAAAGLRVPAYRPRLQQGYRRKLAQVQGAGVE
jgi:hypothetical protein